MKQLLRLRNFLIGGMIVLLVVIGAEIQDDYRQHAKFRTMQDPIQSTENVDLTGLKELKAIGGPILPFSELRKKLEHIKENVIIVDGMGGKYGYVNSTPVCYLGYNESPTLKNLFWRLFYTGTLKDHSELIISEAKEARKHGFEYVGFKIGSKVASSDDTIDKFVDFFDTVPKNTWIYFHCHHGKGRTSIMLVMADILKNAPKVALQDIIKRQYLLGSVDLFDTTPWTKGTYATTTLERRKKFIQNFYDFVCQRKSGGIQQWSDWNRHQEKEKIALVFDGENE